MKLLILEIKIAFTISLVSLGLTTVQAQPDKSVILVQSPTSGSSQQLNKPLIFNTPLPPDDIGAPGHRTAGGKRGCENIDKQFTNVKKKSLTALVPAYDSKSSGLVFGLTTTSNPSFWFYVPYSSKINAEFALQDIRGNIVYQTPVSLSGKPGIVNISLASTAVSLKIGQQYHWYFNIYCQPEQPPISIDGWIQRNSVNSVQKTLLEKATPQQRLTIYASNGYWYDALTTASGLRRNDPKNTDWTTLLQAVGLADIAPEPIVDCCRSEN